MWSTAFGVKSVFMMPLMSLGLSDGGFKQEVIHQAAEPPFHNPNAGPMRPSPIDALPNAPVGDLCGVFEIDGISLRKVSDHAAPNLEGVLPGEPAVVRAAWGITPLRSLSFQTALNLR
jgi:hypothetical protein